jgi:hypothetical protein
MGGSVGRCAAGFTEGRAWPSVNPFPVTLSPSKMGTHMRYMLLIVEPGGQREARTRAEGEQTFARMQRFGDELQAEGKLLAVESLATPARATRVRVRSGQPQMLDGPFAEAKEMIGGFYLVECASPDEALAIARRCPAAEWATVEVRPVSPCYEESNA